MTFGQAIAEGRRKAGLTQRDLAGRVKKEDGRPISAQYLNDIEHDRRSPAADALIGQFAMVLGLSTEYLYYLAGALPYDLRGKVVGEEQVVAAYTAFRKKLREA